MSWLLSAAGAIILLFGFVIFFGAPYLPTLRPQREQALALMNLSPGKLLIELGCGDGSVLLVAAREGLNVVGYEINPILALISWLRTWRYRKNVRVIWGDMWRADISHADGIYIFLLDRYMHKFEKFVDETEHKKGLKLVSYTFKIPHHKPAKHSGGMYLYQLD